MADPITISFAAATLFFGALQATANISSACSAHKANRLTKENELSTGNLLSNDNRVQGYSIIQGLQDFQLVPYNTQQMSHSPSGFGRMVPLNGPAPLTQRLEGWVSLEEEQMSRDTLKDTRIGMHTGRMPGYNLEMAQRHWSHFQSGSIHVPRSIAVVNWSESVITMYEYNHNWQLFFRNYRVVLLEKDLNAFARHYYSTQVFSGIIKDSWLAAHNSYVKMVPKRWWSPIISKKTFNSWSLLGIEGNIRGKPVFMEMKRAALFGLIESRLKDPRLLNVDMVGDKTKQFVKVDTEYMNLDTKGNSGFSVFSFSDHHGWAEDSVLVE